MTISDGDSVAVPEDAAPAGAWEGRSLGERVVSYEERDAILYALAVGALPDELDLVFEDRLRVLPSFGLTLAQWAPDVLAAAGAYGSRSVHGSQTLRVLSALPRSGEVRMSARIGHVWDKGTAAVFEVLVESDFFEAMWTIFAPGIGGFGGDRGPSRAEATDLSSVDPFIVKTEANQALLYRLLGDRHAIHIDPAASALIGQPRPILQGLCTLAAATLPIARSIGVHPADLSALDGRFSGVVVPGDELSVRYLDGRFDVSDEGATVISEGKVAFA